MNFEKFFRFVSYLAVFCGFFSLWVSGTFGFLVTGIFVGVMVTAWFIEGSRWQISEKVGTTLIVLALPVFYVAWRFQIVSLYGSETAVAGILARMILSLAGIKLLQKKSDRDWIFLYLMSFFEVLLAAGLSISALYLASFLFYLLVTICAVVAFEIRKTSHAVELKIAGTAADRKDVVSQPSSTLPVRRLPATAVALIVLIVLVATPLFFMLPRVGGAGFGGQQGGLNTMSGFSDTVTLGQIGLIQENDAVVMRVKLENNSGTDGGLYFRGAVLDTFDNRAWRRSKPETKIVFEKTERDLIQLETAAGRENLLKQTIYLEPLDTPVLFTLSRPIAIQSNFPLVWKDAYGSLTYPRLFERVSYTVHSDRTTPQPAQLRRDDQPYTVDVQNYRDLPPVYDLRIAQLATQVTAGAANRYDKARAVESYLQTNLGYTLERKASGAEPLADFLFNIREGHCEYFATAMAVMLRTQGIATRIVNGFHGGEYNDTADVTVVRQRNAHAWVEVYFPKENVWIPFDPTPFSGQSSGSSSGIAGAVNKYLEAAETFWIQYFVAFDNQEQRSLAQSVRNGFVDYQARVSAYLAVTRGLVSEWLADVRGDRGLQASLTAIGYAIGYASAAVLGVLALLWLSRKIPVLTFWGRLWDRLFKKRHASMVEFYERMQRILIVKGLVREPHQTPLEFAYAIGIPEAVEITEKYNRVRFGERHLSRDEEETIENALKVIEQSEPPKAG